MRHLELTAKQRQRINPDYHGGMSAPACNTGDGHALLTELRDTVDCPRCLEKMREVVRIEDSRTIHTKGEFGRTITGQVLTMGDGQQWFHPYSGGAPVKIA